MKPAEKIAVVGAVVVGAVLLLRRKAQTKPSDPCAGLTGDAKTACEAAILAQGALQWTTDNLGIHWGPLTDENPFKGWREDNIAKNGEPVRQIPKEIFDAYAADDQDNPQYSLHFGATPLNFFVAPDLEYKNGCVPFKDHAGWAKCAPGTHEMIDWEVAGRDCTHPGWLARMSGNGCPTRPTQGHEWSHVGEGKVGTDPLTFSIEGEDPEQSKENHAGGFPLTCNANEERWWVAGKPMCVPACPSGSDREYIDHRSGVQTGPPPCFARTAGTDRTGGAITATPPRPADSTPTTDSHRQGTTASASDYVWVPAAGNVPAHYERRRT